MEGPEVFTGGAFGIEGGLVVTLSTSVGILVLLLFYSESRLDAHPSLPFPPLRCAWRRR